MTSSSNEISGVSTQNSETNLQHHFPGIGGSNEKKQFKKANEQKSIYNQTLNMMFEN